MLIVQQILSVQDAKDVHPIVAYPVVKDLMVAIAKR